MKRVKCKSGITGWQCHLQKNYANLEEFQSYNEIYFISKRLGYESAESAWEANPVVQGSTIPSDFRMVKD